MGASPTQFMIKNKTQQNLQNSCLVWSKFSEQTNFNFCKVHIFWEGHKILRNLRRRFFLCSASQIYSGDFSKFCGLLRIYELYLKIGHKHYVFIVIKIAQNPGFKYLVAGLPTWLPSKPHVLTHLTIGLSARGTHQGYISMTWLWSAYFGYIKLLFFD